MQTAMNTGFDSLRDLFFLQSSQLCKLRVTDLFTPFELVIVCCWGREGIIEQLKATAVLLLSNALELQGQTCFSTRHALGNQRFLLVSELCRLW